jgi:hypothetical protein
MLQQFHYLFSYWIFAWYILYELQLVSYNPKGALMAALLMNMVEMSIMLYYSYSHLFLFMIIIFIGKVLPLWSVIHIPFYKRDLYASIVLFCIYLLWISINKVDVVKIIKLQLHNIKQNKPIGPMMYLIKNV